MKNFLLLFFIVNSTFLFSQTNRIKFNYDNSGNQIQRILCLNCITSRISDQNEEIKDDLVDDFKSIDNNIQVYPNPIEEILNIEILNYEQNPISNILLYDINGKLINEIVINKDDLKYIINFNDLSSGFYVLKFFNNDIEILSTKLLKN